MGLFLSGGLFFMVPLLAASVAVVAIGIERTIRYRQAEVHYPAFLEELRDSMVSEGVVAARSLAAQYPGPVARVWQEGLGAYRLPFPLIRERMESAALEEVSRLERYLSHLALISQVAPLVGILGTVWGMIAAFRVVEGGLAIGDGIRGELLAGGIWQALVTTAAGLVVAIPATLLHHYFATRVERFSEALERSVADLVGCLVPLRTAPTRAQSPPISERNSSISSKSWRQRRRRTHHGLQGWSLAPLIDVLFLLLIFLLVSANFDRRVIMEVELPAAQHGEIAPRLDSEQARVITLFVDGSLRWNGHPTTLEELSAFLAERPEEERLLPISITGDTRAELGAGIGLLDTLRGLGYRNCVFEVRPAVGQ